MPEIYDHMVECEMCGELYHLKCVSLEQFPAEGEQWNCNKKWLLYCSLKYKGAITEVILEWLECYLHRDAKFSREFCMRMPNSLGNFAWGFQIPKGIMLEDAKFPVWWGIPKTPKRFQNPYIGDLTRGTGSPMTPAYCTRCSPGCCLRVCNRRCHSNSVRTAAWGFL